MVFADWDAERVTAWGAAIAGILTGVGGAAVGLYYLYRNRRIELRRKEAEAQGEDDARKLDLSRKSWKTQNDEAQAAAVITRQVREQEAEALREIIADLRSEIKELRAGQRRIQETVTDRLLAADRALGECERKHAVTETELKHTRTELEENTAYTRTLEERIKVLEQRPA